MGSEKQVRRVVANVSVSLDGRVTGPEGDHDMSWVGMHAITDTARERLLQQEKEATDNTTEQASFEPVGQAWSDATLVTHRWGPAALSCPRADVSFSEGDSAIATMRSGELHNLWTYTLIDPMERIEFYSRFCDADGNRVKPADLGMPAEIPEGLPLSQAGQEPCPDQLADVAAMF